jgi:hypothetical protein
MVGHRNPVFDANRGILTAQQHEKVTGVLALCDMRAEWTGRGWQGWEYKAI